MKYPDLVPKYLCKTAISVEIAQEGVDKYGDPLPTLSWIGTCNYQDEARTAYVDGKKKVIVTGTCLIPGDIVPKLPVISGGDVLIMGVKRSIVTGSKNRNPDGTVNFTKLEVR